jgi:hypothetical protein
VAIVNLSCYVYILLILLTDMLTFFLLVFILLFAVFLSYIFVLARKVY